jgi:hypothetical protein
MKVKALSCFFRHARELITCLRAAEEWGQNVGTYWWGCIILGDDSSLCEVAESKPTRSCDYKTWLSVALVVGSWPPIAEAQVQSFSFPLSLSFRQCSIIIHQSPTFFC